MSDATKAVFLSYASQDSEAAKRIADALRAAGVEVWFDQSELVGGDAWDAKIRKQIGSCALFVPIISAGTQARAEGYFRLEWKLADRRTDLIGKSKAFLLPVCIDDTKDADADVPDSFTAVQWTRLKGGEVPAAFVARVQKLLSGSEMEAVRPRPAVPQTVVPSSRGPSKWWWALPIFGVTMALLLVMKEGRREVLPTTAAPVATPVPAAPQSEAQKLVTQMWTTYDRIDDLTVSEITLAEELGERAVKLEPLSADAWAAYSCVTLIPSVMGYDRSDSRRERALKHAQRAIALAPDATNAKLALANCYRLVEETRGEAERLVREVTDREPGNRRALWFAGNALRAQGKFEEALGFYRRAEAVPGESPIPVLNIAVTLLRLERFEEAEAVLDGLLARGTYGPALVHKLSLVLVVREDVEGAARLLEGIPGPYLMREQGAYYAATLALWQRNPEKCIAALRRFPKDDFFGQPKAIMLGQAYMLAGKPAAAALEWRSGAELLEGSLKAKPGDWEAIVGLAYLRACLGEKEEASRLLATYQELKTTSRGTLDTQVVATMTLLGRKEEAIAYLEAAAPTRGGAAPVLRLGSALRYDPIFDSLRGDPRVQALLETKFAKYVPAQPAVTTKAPDKSVAVLAFANLSDDREQEFFSDGISEELLNVLAKVPGLKVTARTSAFFFKGRQVPIAEIAQRLGVAYVVEGSVRKAGDKVRITAQLIKAADGFQVWSDTFTRDLKDIFAVQDEIAGLIARNLELKMELTPARREVNPQAYGLFLEAGQFTSTLSLPNLQRAEKLYQRALELDPGFGRAAGGLALLRAVRVPDIANHYQGAELVEIERSIDQLLRTDPTVAEAYAARAVACSKRGRWAESAAAFRRADELGFNREQTTEVAAFAQINLGRPDLAILIMQTAREVNPLAWTPVDVCGVSLMFCRRFEEAAVALRQATQMNAAPVAFANQALALVALGRKDEAIASARHAVDSPDRADWGKEFLAWSDGMAAWALVDAGAKTEAEAVVRRLLDAPPESRFMAGYALAALGRLDEAAAVFEDHNSDFSYLFYFLNERPALRDDPRFVRLLKNKGVSENFARFRQAVGQPGQKI